MQEKAVQKKCDKIEDIELRIDEGSAKKCKRSSARRIWREEEAAVREDLLRRRLLDRSPSFLCVIETESMATVRLSPRRSPQLAVTYTRSTGVAPNTNPTPT